MREDSEVSVGLDTSKRKIAVALADAGRGGRRGPLPRRDRQHARGTPAAVERLVRKRAERHGRLAFAYDAGPTGYGLQRQIVALGHDGAVVAPPLIPKRPGERVKTNRRDALTLAKPHRAGELTPVWVPDPEHEAIRELVRAREAAMEDLRAKRQPLQSLLLRHGRVYRGRGARGRAHTRWPCELRFEHPAQYLVLAEYRQAIADAEERLERLSEQVTELVPSWSMAPVIAAYQAMRGVAFLTAVTCVAEIGDVRRFETSRQLMASRGLVPSESSTGEQVRRGGITKAGNDRARRVLIEGAWTYRFPARKSRLLQERQAGRPAARGGVRHRLEGRPSCACAAAIASSWPAASRRPWSPPPSRVKWRHSCGRLAVRWSHCARADRRLQVRTSKGGPFGPDRHTLLRIAGGRAPAGEPSRPTVGPTSVDARWQTEAAPDERTGMR